jgi:ribosomal protein S12 methylthiotransferase
MKIFLLTLGCPRNLVDSEVLEGLLLSEGFEITEYAEQADVGIINTCGFIEQAKEESISYILQLVNMKKSNLKKVFVTGCLSQRYPDELLSGIPGIDGVFGTGDLELIPEAVRKSARDNIIKKVSKTPGFLYDHTYPRKILTDGPYAYVKIQEGCSNRCSYCVIPYLKGPLRSREIDSVIKEILNIIEDKNPREIVLIGQDTTAFGLDKTGRSQLPELLAAVSDVAGNRWVRLLYTHPAHFTDDLLDTIASRNNILNYIDMPIQHSSNEILKKMKRKVSKQHIETLISKIRGRLSPVSIRTSVIVGYPGETEKDFEDLLSFINNVRFDRLGAFIYSREEGTPAYNSGPQIDEALKKERFDSVMRLQQEISREKNAEISGREMEVLIDEINGPGIYQGRSFMDAPEVDGVIYVKGHRLCSGDLVNVKITGSMEYDLEGEVI